MNSIEIRDADFENKAELQMLARLYVRAPLSWDPDYTFKEETIENYFVWLLDKKDSLKCLLVLKDSQIMGIHILFKEKESPDCSIKTLWIEPSLRKQGLGSKLKCMGEEWAQQQGAKKLITHVMANNPTMFEINRKKGFVLSRYELIKTFNSEKD